MIILKKWHTTTSTAYLAWTKEEEGDNDTPAWKEAGGAKFIRIMDLTGSQHKTPVRVYKDAILFTSIAPVTFQ